MIYKLIAIPVLSQLKVSTRRASCTQFNSSIEYHMFKDWIGLGQQNGPMFYSVIHCNNDAK